ncbi:MAG: cytochrome P450 [Cyanobacteria bacterium P01_D01_bin.44]
MTDVTRETSKDCQIGGYHIPKGTTLICSQWVMHHAPAILNGPKSLTPVDGPMTLKRACRAGCTPLSAMDHGFVLARALP